MSDLKITALDMTFNVLVQTMQAIHAPNFIVSDDAEEHAAYAAEQFARRGVITVPNSVGDNSVFGDDEVYRQYYAWKTSAALRMYKAYGYVQERMVWATMQEDIMARYVMGPREGKWNQILWAMVIGQEYFYKRWNRYPVEMKRFVKLHLDKEQA